MTSMQCIRDRFHGAPWIVVSAACLLVFAAAGCGDDDSTTPETTIQRQIAEGLQGLAMFGVNALSGSEMQVMNHPSVSNLMDTVGLGMSDFGTALGGLAPALPQGVSHVLRGSATLFPSLGQASAIGPIPFGTYVRDRSDTTEPFPGWVLETANVPADGLIFRFPADPDDIVVYDNGQTVPVAGELRFLAIVLDQTGPLSPEDDIVTSMTFEMALGQNLEVLTTVARIAFQVTLDTNREPMAMRIGDEGDLTSTFIGPLSLAMSMAVTGDVMNFLVRIADMTTVPAYVLRLTLSMTGYNEVTEVPSALSFSLGYGETMNPASPPWEIATTLDNFRVDPNDPNNQIADVNGTISFNEDVLATYTGDTTTYQFDYDFNGDGVVDEFDSCINVNITFTGARESHNICEAFDQIAGSIPSGGLGALLTRPTSPLLWVR